MTDQADIAGLGAITKDSPIPLYFQLKELLRQEIESGRWQPGQQIPSETEMCEAFGISRTVVRQALRELEYHGLLYREQGKGTFVAEPKISESLVQDLSGFYEDMVAKGLTPVTRVLRQEIQPANKKVARYLHIQPGDEIVFIERVRSVGGEPIVLVTTYLPYHVCPDLVDEDLSCSRHVTDGVGRLGVYFPDWGPNYQIKGLDYDVPYRCLVPQAVDGLLVAGRGISCDVVAANTMRLIVPCIVTGQAAGAAAALAVREACVPREVPVAELQALLREQGTGVRWHIVMAGNVLLSVPALVVFALTQKYLLRAVASRTG